jgi:hypothetical protein
VDSSLEGKPYYYSSKTQNPTHDNSVFDSTEDFVHAMLNSTAPTMLMYGESYLKGHEINLEDAFPISFWHWRSKLWKKGELMYQMKVAFFITRDCH